LTAKELLHLGSRTAVDQLLSRLVQRGCLLRAGRGIYVRPIESRFGTRAPSAVKMTEGLANQRGEIIVSHGAAAANALGLTTQVPMRAVYLTSGPSRRLKLGAQMVIFVRKGIRVIRLPFRLPSASRRHWRALRRSQTASATRRNAQLLSSSSRLNRILFHFWTLRH
jgi:hypothetical protein